MEVTSVLHSFSSLIHFINYAHLFYSFAN